jgi:hypothetical protein
MMLKETQWKDGMLHTTLLEPFEPLRRSNQANANGIKGNGAIETPFEIWLPHTGCILEVLRHKSRCARTDLNALFTRDAGGDGASGLSGGLFCKHLEPPGRRRLASKSLGRRNCVPKGCGATLFIAPRPDGRESPVARNSPKRMADDGAEPDKRRPPSI